MFYGFFSGGFAVLFMMFMRGYGYCFVFALLSSVWGFLVLSVIIYNEDKRGEGREKRFFLF
jgi:hypothetical protein